MSARHTRFTNERHTYRRFTFVAIVVATWIIGVFGLQRGRMSSFQLPLVVAAGLLGYGLVVAIRNHVAAGRGSDHHDHVEPRTCVVVRRFGEDVKPRTSQSGPVVSAPTIVELPARVTGI